MIVLFKDNKIVGIDNNLLNLLNINLDNLSNIISEIELFIASKEKNKLNLQNHLFEINEIPLTSIENIKAFDLTKTTETKQEFNLEQLSPNLQEHHEFNIEEPLLKIEEPLKNTFETTIEQPIQEIKIPDLTIPETTENLIISEEEKPTNTPQEQEIVLSFEDNMDEINKILSLNEKEANKLISEDLKKASEDLGIDFQMINDLYKDLLNQFKNEKKSLYEAIEKQDYEKIHKIAHTLKGASLNLRLSNLALILKNIDEESKAYKPIEEIKFLIDKFYDFVDKIDKKNKIPDNIKNLIILTIQEYLSSQNEKKFKKDLKYIEKLLNTKINSLEELQNLVKD